MSCIYEVLPLRKVDLTEGILSSALLSISSSSEELVLTVLDWKSEKQLSANDKIARDNSYVVNLGEVEALLVVNNCDEIDRYSDIISEYQIVEHDLPAEEIARRWEREGYSIRISTRYMCSGDVLFLQFCRVLTELVGGAFVVIVPGRFPLREGIYSATRLIETERNL